MNINFDDDDGGDGGDYVCVLAAAVNVRDKETNERKRKIRMSNCMLMLDRRHDVMCFVGHGVNEILQFQQIEYFHQNIQAKFCDERIVWRFSSHRRRR